MLAEYRVLIEPFQYRLDAHRVELALVAGAKQYTGLDSAGEGQAIAGSRNHGFLMLNRVFENAI
jgi:hypothetical protein